MLLYIVFPQARAVPARLRQRRHGRAPVAHPRDERTMCVCIYIYIYIHICVQYIYIYILYYLYAQMTNGFRTQQAGQVSASVRLRAPRLLIIMIIVTTYTILWYHMVYYAILWHVFICYTILWYATHSLHKELFYTFHRKRIRGPLSINMSAMCYRCFIHVYLMSYLFFQRAPAEGAPNTSYEWTLHLALPVRLRRAAAQLRAEQREPRRGGQTRQKANVCLSSRRATRHPPKLDTYDSPSWILLLESLLRLRISNACLKGFSQRTSERFKTCTVTIPHFAHPPFPVSLISSPGRKDPPAYT